MTETSGTALLNDVWRGLRLRRHVGPDGIEVAGLRYDAPILQTHRALQCPEPVEVRVDREDLGTVAVRLGGGWLILRCVAHGVEGVSLRERLADWDGQNDPSYAGTGRRSRPDVGYTPRSPPPQGDEAALAGRSDATLPSTDAFDTSVEGRASGARIGT